MRKLKNHVKHSLQFAAALTLPLSILIAGTASASGSAYFTLSPSSGSHAVGSTFTVSVYETGTGVQAVQANLSYPASLLQYESGSVGSKFNIPVQNTGGSGSVKVAAGASPSVSGEQLVVTISFKVLSTGTATVSMVSGSDIDNGTGTSIWNGSLPHATFSLASSTSSSGGSTSSSSGSGTTSASTSSGSTTPKPKTTTKKSTPKTTTQTTQPATASLEVTVTDSKGEPIANAKVTIDNSYSKYTNTQGKADFSGLNTGKHTVTVTANSKKSSQASITLAANQSKPLTLKLASNPSATPKIIAAAVVLAIILGGAAFWYFRIFRKPFRGGASSPETIVVNGQQLGQPRYHDQEETSLAQRLQRLPSARPPSLQRPQQQTPPRLIQPQPPQSQQTPPQNSDTQDPTRHV